MPPAPPPAPAPIPVRASSHTKAIIALVVLVLLVLGFYFWRAPMTAQPVVSSVCPAQPAALSISGNLSGNLEQVAPGATLIVTGTITNTSVTAVSGATLYAKVVREDSGTASPVDFFPLDAKVSLAPGADASVSFSWQAPADAPSGQYTVGLALLSADGSVEAGTPTPGGPAFATYAFDIAGGADGAVAFDSNSIAVSNITQSAGLPIYADGANPTSLDLGVTNDSSLGVKASLTWTLYAGPLPVGNPLSTETGDLKVQPKGSADVSYALTDHEHAAYYLLASFTTKNGAKSIIGLPILNSAFMEQCAATSTPSTL